MRVRRGVFVFLAVLLLTTAKAEAMIIISEILADPATGLAGDSNKDGAGSATGDEFVELFNNGGDTEDLAGWYLSDAVKPRHVFPFGTTILSGGILVVFGGGLPNLPGINWQTASTGTLLLNNTADTVTLSDKSGNMVDSYTYGSEANNDQSLVRSPEGTKGVFVPHLTLAGANGRAFSPGYFVAPPVPEKKESPFAIPEPLSLYSLGSGLALLLLKLKRHS